MTECTTTDLSLMNGGVSLIASCVSRESGFSFPTSSQMSTCLISSGITPTCSTCMGSVVDEFGACVSTTCEAWSGGVEVPTTLSAECRDCASSLNSKYLSAETICGIDPNGLPGNMWTQFRTQMSTALGTNSAETSLRSVVTSVIVGTILMLNL